MRWFLEQLATKVGLQHPDMASSAAVLVIEQTIARTQMTGSLKEVQTARLLFQCLQHAYRVPMQFRPREDAIAARLLEHRPNIER